MLLTPLPLGPKGSPGAGASRPGPRLRSGWGRLEPRLRPDDPRGTRHSPGPPRRRPSRPGRLRSPILRGATRPIGGPEAEDRPISWTDRLEDPILRHEADALILPDPISPPNPFAP